MSMMSAVALVGGLFSAGVTGFASKPPSSVSEAVLVALFVCWGCVPYLVAYLMSRVALRPTMRSMLLFGLAGYALLDGVVRVQALYFPTGSTDALIIIFMPIWSPVVMIVVGGSAAAILSKVRHRRAVEHD